MQYHVILLDHSDDGDKADDNGEGMTMMTLMMMIAIRGSCRVCPTCVNKYLGGGGEEGGGAQRVQQCEERQQTGDSQDPLSTKYLLQQIQISLATHTNPFPHNVLGLVSGSRLFQIITFHRPLRILKNYMF